MSDLSERIERAVAPGNCSLRKIRPLISVLPKLAEALECISAPNDEQLDMQADLVAFDALTLLQDALAAVEGEK